MLTRSKPEASYASTRLSFRNNPNGGPPLTTVMGKPVRRRSNQAEEPEPKPRMKAEPATDDEPESSTDEDDASDSDLSDEFGSRRRNRERGTTLQEKMAASEAAAEQERGSSSRRNENGNGNLRSVRTGQKRANSFGGASSDEEMFPSVSQASKRSRKRTYGSKASFNRPSSNGPSSSLPQEGPSNSQKGKPEETEDKDGGFKFPMEIDLGSPAPRTRTGASAKTNNDVKPTDLSIVTDSSATSSAKDHWLFDDGDSDLSTPLSSASSSFLLELSQVDDSLAATEQQTKQSECPVCKKQVDAELLEAFLLQPKQLIRDQLRFCDSHQQTDAGREWQEKRYPTIDWDRFDERIQGHFADLDQLLVPDSPSFYRNVLVTTLKSGKARNFRLTLAGDGLETIACGYYGTRGASEMSAPLHFSLPRC